MNRQEWNELVLRYAPPFGAFLQSWEWGAFQQQLGRQVERVYHVDANGVLLGQAIKMDLPLGQFYWYLPKGPLGTMSQARMESVLREELPDATFLRIEPRGVSRLLQVVDVQPRTTLQLDLTQSEETLLMGMKSKTRYNIRLSERKGVVCRQADLEAFEDFIRLMDQTTQRDQFVAHPDVYYRTMLESLSGQEARARLIMAYFEGRPIAGNIVLDFHGVRSYLHGATSNLHRNVMAQYALHWYVILEAKRAGMQAFDFWGVAPEDAGPEHPWAGISRYKQGFGGRVLEMPGTFDLPMRHLWYSMYRMGKKVRTGR